MAELSIARRVPLVILASLFAGGCVSTVRPMVEVPFDDAPVATGVTLATVSNIAWAVKSDAATGTYALETATGRAVVSPGSRTIFVATLGAEFEKRRLSQPVTLAGDGTLRVPTDFAVTVPELLNRAAAVQIATPPTKPAEAKIEFAPIATARDFTIVIDPGHGGKDPGACGASCNEKTCVLAVGLALDIELRTRGFKTVLTRKDDTFVELAGRVAISNANRGDLFVSLHANAAAAAKANGTETIYASQVLSNRSSSVVPHSKALAERVQHVFSRNIPSPDRGAKENVRNLHVLRNAKVPAVLVEMGFVTNPDEGKLLAANWYQKKLARLIAQAVDEWYLEHHAPRAASASTFAKMAAALPAGATAVDWR
jgi:N-acetylmuramoyl-L-alanine amidase